MTAFLHDTLGGDYEEWGETYRPILPDVRNLTAWQVRTLELADAYRGACAVLPEARARLDAIPLTVALEFESVSEARHDALKTYHTLAQKAADARRALLKHAGGGEEI